MADDILSEVMTVPASLPASLSAIVSRTPSRTPSRTHAPSKRPPGAAGEDGLQGAWQRLVRQVGPVAGILQVEAAQLQGGLPLPLTPNPNPTPDPRRWKQHNYKEAYPYP